MSISLRGNEQCEPIAHFAHQKWANEWIAHFLERIAHKIRSFWTKTSDSLGNQMSEFPALPFNKQFTLLVFFLLFTAQHIMYTVLQCDLLPLRLHCPQPRFEPRTGGLCRPLDQHCSLLHYEPPLTTHCGHGWAGEVEQQRHSDGGGGGHQR